MQQAPDVSDKMDSLFFLFAPPCSQFFLWDFFLPMGVWPSWAWFPIRKPRGRVMLRTLSICLNGLCAPGANFGAPGLCCSAQPTGLGSLPFFFASLLFSSAFCSSHQARICPVPLFSPPSFSPSRPQNIPSPPLELSLPPPLFFFLFFCVDCFVRCVLCGTRPRVGGTMFIPREVFDFRDECFFFSPPPREVPFFPILFLRVDVRLFLNSPPLSPPRRSPWGIAFLLPESPPPPFPPTLRRVSSDPDFPPFNLPL